MNILDSIKHTTKYNYLLNNDNTFHIGYGIDDNFSRCAGTSIASICQNNKNENFHFHIIGLDISDKNKFKFCQLAQQEKISITIYDIDSLFFNTLPTKTNLPIPTYFRFLFPLILKDIPKIYYIDSDIICLKSLSKFFNTELKNNIIAAIPDDKWINDLQNPKLGLKNHKYFNAGVLIIDTLKWNKNQITNCLLDALNANPDKFNFLDQDALNLILTHKITYIDKIFNYHNNKSVTFKDNIALLHFVHIPKPWHLSYYFCDNINNYNKYLYKSFEDLTPWKNTPYTLPATYKEMRYHAMYLRKHKYYFKSIYWHFKYIINKVLTKTKNIYKDILSRLIPHL